MPSTLGSATSRTRSVTPEGICPVFDFKELDLQEPCSSVAGAANKNGDTSSAHEQPATVAPAVVVEDSIPPAPGGVSGEAQPVADGEDGLAAAGARLAAPEEPCNGAFIDGSDQSTTWDPWDPWAIGDKVPGGCSREPTKPLGDQLGGHAGGKEKDPAKNQSLEARPKEEDVCAAELRELEELAEMSAALLAGVQPTVAELESIGQAMNQPQSEAPSPPATGPEPEPEHHWAGAAAVEWADEEAERQRRLHEERICREGEMYVVTIATFVNIYPLPDDQSTPVLGRVCRNDLVHVFEWDESRTWRRCRTKNEEGKGPMYGWVKVITWKYGPLLVPVNEKVQMLRLLQGDNSGVLASVIDDMVEENVQRRVPEMLRDKRSSRLEQLRTARRIQTPGSDAPLRVDDGRLVLGPWPRPKSRTTFKRALVMGAHHTCTTALTRELEAQFFVKVENNYDTVLPDSRPENHKHRVMHYPPNPQDALVICLVKDPCFWLQSLTRHAATYAIYALQKMPDGSYDDIQSRHVGAMDERPQEELLDAILDTVEFFGDIYPNGGAIRVWEASVRSYFDEAVYPLHRTAVVRCEDFLFSFDAVMEALAELGLQRRPKPPPPNGKRSKGGVIHFKARDREEALCWYGDEGNRHVGLEPRHVQAVSVRLGANLLDPLGYGEDAVRSWSSRPLRIFIAGSWGSYQPVPMAWNGRSFMHNLRIGRDGKEHFQLLLDGKWESVLYPSVADAGPEVDHEILGPDSMGHGKNWTISRQHGVRPGDHCIITVEVDHSGLPVMVLWVVVD